MKNLIQRIQDIMEQETRSGAFTNITNLADLSSSLKDLQIVSLVSDLKEGKLEIVQSSLGNRWYLAQRS